MESLLSLSRVAGDSDAVGTSDSDGGDLPVDAEALEAAAAAARDSLAQLERDTLPNLVRGCERLLARKQRRVTQAHANADSCQHRARVVYEHACSTARASHARQCEALQRSIGDDLARELERLRNAQAGVSVTSRRRRGLHPPMMEREMERGREAESNGCSDADEDGDYVRRKEKKWLDALLARPTVFPPLEKELAPELVASDLVAIHRSLARSARRRGLVDGTAAKSMANGPASKTVSGFRRRRLVTPRHVTGTQHTLMPSGIVKATSISVSKARSRLPLLEEGQEVAVYRRAVPGEEIMKPCIDSYEDTGGRMECVLTGILAAATKTHVFVLLPTGGFDAIDVQDWVSGRVAIRGRSPDHHRRQDSEDDGVSNERPS